MNESHKKILLSVARIATIAGIIIVLAFLHTGSDEKFQPTRESKPQTIMEMLRGTVGI